MICKPCDDFSLIKMEEKGSEDFVSKFYHVKLVGECSLNKIFVIYIRTSPIVIIYEIQKVNSVEYVDCS